MKLLLANMLNPWGSQIYLAAGTRVPFGDLLKAITIASANDASVAVAEAIAGTYSNFINIMNRRAQELGMKILILKTPPVCR